MSKTDSKTVLTKKDYLKTSLRAYFLQNGFNYGNYQGLGYANILYPALKKRKKEREREKGRKASKQAV